jgi:transposase
MDGVGDNATHQHRHQHRHEAGDYRRIELITGTARRRRWTAEEKAALVAESLRPGINISDLARRCGVNAGLLQTWRRKARQEAAVFIPLRVEGPGERTDEVVAGAPPPTAVVPHPGLLEIESGGVRIRFSGPVDAAALRLVLTHLGRRA